MNRTLIVCGASGVGKSSVAAEVSRVLASTGRSVAFIDVDTVAQFGPAPWDRRDEVSFYDTLKCKNVEALWVNFRGLGARHIAIAACVDGLRLRAQYEQALKDCALQVALLVAPPELPRER